MAENSDLMDWSPCGVAQNLNVNTPQRYYRDTDMPGAFPLTPPSAPTFGCVRPATDDGSILNASKRICTIAARAAGAITSTASCSMTTIIRNWNMHQFRTRRPHRLEGRRVTTSAVPSVEVTPVTSSKSPPGLANSTPKEAQNQRNHTSESIVKNQSTIKIRSPFSIATPKDAIFPTEPSQSPSGLGIPTPKESQILQHNTLGLKIEPQSTSIFRSPFSFFAPSNAVPASKPSQRPAGHKISRSKEAQTWSINTTESVVTSPKVKISSPFPVFKPTYGSRLTSSQYIPDSSPARQLAAELDTAAEDSDTSSTLDGNWIPTTPIIQIQKPTTPTTQLSSVVPDTADWYHDGTTWTLHSDLTKSPSKHSTTKSRAEELEEGQGNSRQTRRTILKAKIALGDTSKFDIKPLSEDWEARVNNALKNGHGRLQARDFQKIVPPNGKAGMEAWLNDESINEYLGLVTKHANKDIKPKSTPRMHAFSTFFFTSLRQGGYQKVARWAKRAHLAGATLLDVEKIFIPINPNQNHWTLAVIQPRIQRITHYNSLGGGTKAYLDVVCDWLQGELGAGFVKADWDLDYTTESPQQTNGSDCGVFTVTTAKQLMLGISPMAYGAEDIPTQRRRMVAELVNGELLQISN